MLQNTASPSSRPLSASGTSGPLATQRKCALVPAVARAVALLDRLAEACEPMGLAQLAADLALPKSSVHGLCNTLVTCGYLRRRSDGRFFIGPHVLGLARAFATHATPVREFQQLWDGTQGALQDAVTLSVLDGNESVCVAVHDGRRPLGSGSPLGSRWPAHRCAAGLAMLACQGDAWVRQLYPMARLPSFAGLPAMRRTELLNELATARERGHAVADEGALSGWRCVAAPVLDANGAVVAGVSLGWPKAHTQASPATRRHGHTVMQLAQQLTQQLGGPARPRIPSPANSHVAAARRPPARDPRLQEN